MQHVVDARGAKASGTGASGLDEIDQVAALLGIAPRTVARDWRFAATFLKALLT